MIDKILFGKHLTKKRRALGLTQSQLADQIHVSFQAVSKWERGLSLPDGDVLKIVCKTLGINEGLRIFEIASSLSLRELIDDVNLKGITGDKYIGLGALVQSSDFSTHIIDRFSNFTIRKVLNKLLGMRVETEQQTLNQTSHTLCKMFVEEIGIDDIILHTQKINNVPFCFYKIREPYPTAIMTKLARRIAEAIQGVAFLVNDVPSEENTQFTFACTNKLVSSGFNCLYFRGLCEVVSLRMDIETGASGGGFSQQSSLIMKKSYLNPNAIVETEKLLSQYIQMYKSGFSISLVPTPGRGEGQIQ
jgi:transcriptional regulator with XRE-family HTH domain